MRLTRVISVAALLLAALAAGASPASSRTLASGVAGQAAQSAFDVQPDIADPACGGGHGVSLPAKLGAAPVIASATMANGDTLIATSSGYPAIRLVTLRSLGSTCAPTPTFGSGGVATLGIAAHVPPLKAPPPGGPSGLLVFAIAPAADGDAILAGSYADRWVVGEVEPGGRLDRSFGNEGWTVLPFPGQLTAVSQEPSGRILVAGDDGGAGCCSSNWAAALSAHGQLKRSFGSDGRTQLPSGEDSGVEGLAAEPNGDILTQVDYGNMGCWGVSLATLTPSGRTDASFAQSLGAYWAKLDDDAFVGGAVVHGDGFTLIGTGQGPCVSQAFSARSASGLFVRFESDGRLAGKTIRFAPGGVQVAQVLQVGAEAIVVSYPYANPSKVTLTAFHPDGAVDVGFGSNGRAVVGTSSVGPASSDVSVSVVPAAGNAVVVIASRSGVNGLQVVRLLV